MKAPLRFLLLFSLLLIVAGAAFGQGVQTATLNGTVTSDGAPLPGVTVTATSSALIGSRVTVTSANGDYVIRGVPPGEYKLLFEMQGLQTVEVMVMASLGAPARADAEMSLSVAAEAIIVTADAPTALETSTVGQNTTYETVQALPVGQTPTAIAALAAGVSGGDRENRTQLTGQLSISGGMNYDNNIMINGINVQDNVFGQTNNLFIEDAIQETQVLTSGISAEYGAFTGGVVNVLTKSGGNEFTASIRGDFTKPEWRDETPYEDGYRGEGVTPATPTKREGDLGKVYSLTAGGRIIKDRLWFFGAVRDTENTNPYTTPVTGIQIPRVQNNRRWEVKLTGNLTDKHSMQASYVENPDERTHEIQINPIELAAIGLNSVRENDGYFINYNGIFTSKLFAEARYSQKHFGFRGLGGTSTDIHDSPFVAYSYMGVPVPGYASFNAPYFDATDPEDRDNEQFAASASYYLSTGGAGSHDIKGGFERFTTTRTGGNSQTSTSYVFDSPYLTDADGEPVYQNGRLVPNFVGDDAGLGWTSEIEWWLATRGAKIDVTTDSFFLQDRWDINQNWTANIGVRYESASSDVSGADVVTFDTKTFMPRLAVSYDPLADGRYRFDVTYAEYAGRYNPSIVGSNSPVGNPSGLFGYYIGPSGTGWDFAPGWDPDNYVWYSAYAPTQNIFQDSNLQSPISREITFSAGMALPKGGWLKATFTDRKMSDFIEDFTTMETGTTVVVVEGLEVGEFDNDYYTNSSEPVRDYQAILLQSRYMVTQNWLVEGNYTYQIKNEGNYEGESGQSLPLSSIGDYPELQSPRNYQLGRLDDYQEHKFRLWTTYNLSLGWAGSLTTGLLYRYDSPRTHSYTATVPLSNIQLARDPGYASPPSTQTLYFGERGAGEYDSYSVFDLSLNWNLPLWNGKVNPWIKVDVTNLLNDDTQIFWSTSVRADPNSPLDADGLPTGYIKNSSFGRPTGITSYMVPREFLLSAGIRF